MIIPGNPQYSSRQDLLSTPFYRWENWNLERPSILLKITQLIKRLVEARPMSRSIWPQNLGSVPYMTPRLVIWHPEGWIDLTGVWKESIRHKVERGKETLWETLLGFTKIWGSPFFLGRPFLRWGIDVWLSLANGTWARVTYITSGHLRATRWSVCTLSLPSHCWKNLGWANIWRLGTQSHSEF